MNYPDPTPRSSWLDILGLVLTIMLTVAVYSFLAKS